MNVDLRGLGPSSVLVRRVLVPAGPFDGAQPGPVPFTLPSNTTTQARDGRAATDVKARRTLIAPQQADVLYGYGETWRQHWVTADGGTGVLAVELLSGPRAPSDKPLSDGLLAVHLTSPEDTTLADHLDRLAPLAVAHTDEARTLWAAAMAHLPAHADLPREAVRRISFYDEASEPGARDPLLSAYALVSAVDPSRLPDLEARSTEHAWTVNRTDWSALVLRDGMAFVATPTSAEPFAPSLKAFTHSIHLDALLLALLQRRLIDASGAAAVAAPIDSPDALVDLEKRHFDFKRRYWRTSLTDKRTAPSDAVFQELQEQLLTPKDVSDVEDRVLTGARLARTLHAERTSEEQHRLSVVVELAAIVIGAFGLSYAAASAISDPSWAVFAWATVAGLVVTLVAIGVRHLRR